MDRTSPPIPETREQSPPPKHTHRRTIDLVKYDLIIGRRGFKGYCSEKVHEFLGVWFPHYANTKNKSSFLQQQVYPDFVLNKFKAYSKDPQGLLFLETDETKIIAKLKKEMDLIKSKENEDGNVRSKSRKRAGEALSGSTPQKRKGPGDYVNFANSSRDDVVTLEGEELLLQAYMDEIPFKSTGLGPTSTFRTPGFHTSETGPVSVNNIQPDISQAYVKDVFQWQDFESYAIPPSLGHESGSPTASTILRSISSGVYISPETVPEIQQNEGSAFSSASIDNTKLTVSWANKTAPLDQQAYNTPGGIVHEKDSRLPFSDCSVSDQNHHKKLSIDSAVVSGAPDQIRRADYGVDSDAKINQGDDLSPKVAGLAIETSKKKLSKRKQKLVPRFNGPSPISFQVLNPSRRAPQLAPKPPSLVDMMIGAVKQIEHRAESLERENMAVWKRLHELELKYEAMLSASNGRDDEGTEIFQV